MNLVMCLAFTGGLALGIVGCSEKTCETIADDISDECGVDYIKDYFEAAGGTNNRLRCGPQVRFPL